MQLTAIFAKQQFEKLRQIDRNGETVLHRLTSKPDSINYIFNGVIYTLCSGAPMTVKSRKDKLEYIYSNHPTHPGVDLITETNSLAKDLNDYFKSYKVPTDADYRLCIKRFARFLAFYANMQVPDDIVTIYSTIPQPKMALTTQDLIDNPTTRVPVVLCLDTSGSMMGDKISELNKGVKQFFEAVKNDDIAKYSVELCIVTFSQLLTKYLTSQILIDKYLHSTILS